MTAAITTGDCIEHGRWFQGYELREEYAAIARARIDTAASLTEVTHGGDW